VFQSHPGFMMEPHAQVPLPDTRHGDVDRGSWRREELRKDLMDLCLEVELRYLATLDSSSWSKKFH
jgi:hypothetical protein